MCRIFIYSEAQRHSCTFFSSTCTDSICQNIFRQQSCKINPTNMIVLQPLFVPCVCQREIHAYLRYPSGLFFDTSLYASLYLLLSHFLSSVSPEARSNRAHQTGWSEQNCNVLLIDSESVCVCVVLCLQIVFRWLTYKHLHNIFQVSCACVCEPVLCVYELEVLYLSSQLNPPEMKGRRKMMNWRRFFAAWRPRRAQSAADQGYWNRMKADPFKYSNTTDAINASIYFCLNTVRNSTRELLEKFCQNLFSTLPVWAENLCEGPDPLLH